MAVATVVEEATRAEEPLAAVEEPNAAPVWAAPARTRRRSTAVAEALCASIGSGDAADQPEPPAVEPTPSILDQALLADGTGVRPDGSANRPPWAASTGSPAQATEAASTVYCDTCWAPLAENATECPDCCRSRADMVAESERRAEADRTWKPERPDLAEDDVEAPFEAIETAPESSAPTFSPPTWRPRSTSPGPGLGVLAGPLKPLAYAAGIALVVGTVTAGCFWLSLATFR